MAQRRSVAFCVLYINWGNSGYSERYFLPSNSWATAERVASQLARHRIAACCSGAKLIWGRIGFTDDLALTQPISAIGLTSDEFFGPGRSGPNEAFTRCFVRYETAEGRWSNRLFGAIPDDVIRFHEVMGELPYYLPGQPVQDPGDINAEWKESFGAFVAFARDNTIHAWKEADEEGGFYGMAPWNTTVYRGVTTRDTGRDFQRVSFESARSKPPGVPGVNPPTDAAAAFTACGAAVMVTRSCYTRPCQWYVNGPIGRIRYYFVPETNEILWERNRFWPYKQDLAIVNTDHTGERTGAGYRYDKGTPRRTLDGSHPAGTAADFAGQTRIPWDPPTPTPAESLPDCDFAILPADLVDLECGDGFADVASGVLSGGLQVYPDEPFEPGEGNCPLLAPWPNFNTISGDWFMLPLGTPNRLSDCRWHTDIFFGLPDFNGQHLLEIILGSDDRVMMNLIRTGPGGGDRVVTWVGPVIELGDMPPQTCTLRENLTSLVVPTQLTVS